MAPNFEMDGPSSETETLFLERQRETVPNHGDEDSELFSSRVDQLLIRLRSIDVHKTEKQIVNIPVRNLSITTRLRSAPGLTLLFSGTKTWNILC